MVDADHPFDFDASRLLDPSAPVSMLAGPGGLRRSQPSSDSLHTRIEPSLLGAGTQSPLSRHVDLAHRGTVSGDGFHPKSRHDTRTGPATRAARKRAALSPTRQEPPRQPRRLLSEMARSTPRKRLFLAPARGMPQCHHPSIEREILAREVQEKRRARPSEHQCADRARLESRRRLGVLDRQAAVPGSGP